MRQWMPCGAHEVRGEAHEAAAGHSNAGVGALAAAEKARGPRRLRVIRRCVFVSYCDGGSRCPARNVNCFLS